MDVAIVAIPGEYEPIHQVSSEKIAHMTLLYLGNVPDEQLPVIGDFVEHAVNRSSLSPFYLDVAERTTLGPEDADVLIFKETTQGFKTIAEFRSYLLTNDVISTAYQNAFKFDKWTPHLTLGYQGAPARKKDRYAVLDSVYFDRIMYWYKDFDGDTYQLRYHQELSMEMPFESVLEHHGVKGQKWGVIRNRFRRSGDRHGHAGSTDHVVVKNIERKRKTSGTKVLTNAELRTYVERLELEARLNRISPTSAKTEVARRARKEITDVLINVGKQQATAVLSKEAGKWLAKGIASAAKSAV